MGNWLKLGMVVTLTSGCMHTAYSTGVPRAQHKPTVDGTNHFFLGGLVNSATVDTDAICTGQPVSRVETNESFLDGFLSVITFGIYTPRSYRVWCGKTTNLPGSVSVPAEGIGHKELR